MKKQTQLALLALTASFAFTQVAHAQTVFVFSNGTAFDSPATTGATMVADAITMEITGITGFADNTSTSALISTGHRMNIDGNINALSVNSDFSGGYTANDSTDFNPGEAWTISFDQEVSLNFLNFSGFSETGTGFLLTSSAFSDINIQVGDIVSNIYTFAPGILASAGTDVTMTMTKSGAFSSSDGFRIREFTVTAVPEPSSYALIGGCLALAAVAMRRR